MLIVSRKPGEDVLIGDDIVVRFIEFRSGGKIRLGVQAPPETSVDRREIREAKARDAAAAKPLENA